MANRKLTALKVKIGLKDSGQAKYPDFNQLQVVKDMNMDWAKYVDTHGLGWHYDKTSGHKDDTDDSPFGQQWGCLVVPAAFATQAVAMFPDDCEIIDDTAFGKFHDEKAHAHEPDELIDKTILDGIKVKQDLGLELTATQTKALDPEDDTPGIRMNVTKTWAGRKAKLRVELEVPE